MLDDILVSELIDTYLLDSHRVLKLLAWKPQKMGFKTEGPYVILIFKQ